MCQYEQDKECVICYSSGKTKQEETFDMFFNKNNLDYPLVLLKDAYECKCKKYAHNICILFINRCPTCSKFAIPKLYVRTKYDYYLKYLLNWLKKDMINIVKLNRFMVYCMIFGLLVLGCCAMFEGEIKESKILQKNRIINFLFSSVIALAIYVPIFILSSFNDYLKKYWLYNADSKTYDVFLF